MIPLFHNVKGSVIASFFLIFFSLNVFSSPAEALYESPQWRSLLHIPKDFSQISDVDFVGQKENAAQMALLDGIENLKNNTSKDRYLCQYPARSLWIAKHYPEIQIGDPLEKCQGLAQYIERVPADKVVLVYAYENIEQPASMMGHVFLMFSGKNTAGLTLEHAVSFYTDTSTYNLPKLLFDSLVFGKEGFFIVSPYKEQLQQYNLIEQRNVIEYELLMDDFDRKLLRFHIWELKDVEMKYFFNKFNCATLTNNLIAVANPEVLEASDDWLSPLDVVKASYRSDLLAPPVLRASDSWKIRMLSDALNKEGIDAEKELAQPDNQILTEDQRFLLYSLDESIRNFELSNVQRQARRLTEQERFDLALNWGVKKNSGQFIELSSYKNPLERAEDSQFNITLIEKDELLLQYIPTSHQVSDDHRTSFSESELELLSFKVRASRRTGKTELDELTLYKMASYIPYDTFTGGLSKKFSVGMKNIENDQLQSKRMPYINGGLGISFALHQDFYFYSMLNAQLEEGWNASLHPEIGLFLYEVYSLKTSLSYSEAFHQRGADKRIQYLKVDQSWFFDTSYSLVFHYENQRASKKQNDIYSLEIRHYF